VEAVIPQSTVHRQIGLAACALLALSLLGGCASIVPAYGRDLQAAHARISSGNQLADTPCGPIEYAIQGEGPPLLVVHGAGGGFDQGLIIGAPLVKAGYRIIAVSRFGYLRTPLPQDASPAAQADAYVCLLDALSVPQADVLAASAGSPSALQFALRHPDRVKSLVLLVPMLFAPPAEATAPQKHAGGGSFALDTVLRSDFLLWLGPRLDRAMVEKAMGTPPADVEHASPEEQARVASLIDQILPVGPRRPGLTNDMEVIAGLPRYDLEQVAVPTLVLSTADDLFRSYPAALYTAVHIPKARFIGYTTGGHMMVGDEDDAVTNIAAFLRSGSSPKPVAAGAQAGGSLETQSPPPI
jgi:pimeloyl-ACP methyl ester carboxylesterase